MKNLLFLGAVALLLFSLSAALSLWLNQSKKEAEGDKVENKDAGKALPKAAPPPAEGPKDAIDKKTVPPITPPTIGTPEAGVLDQQAKLERKALQITMVLADVQSQREATDALLRQVTAELKNAPKVPAPDPNEQKLLQDRKRALEDERKNLIQLATIYDSMTPEGGASNLKAMAESGPGKLEQVAQILMLMQKRNAARVMEALNDPALVAQLMDKMRQLRSSNMAIAPDPAPAPAALPAFGTAVPGTPSNVVPARGP